MEDFRERLNRNEERRRDRDSRGGREPERDGRERDQGYGGRTSQRPGRDEPETPGGSSTSAARLRNQSWDSTPSRGGPLDPSATPRSRASWDSTPRSTSGRRDEREWDTPRSIRVAGGDESPYPLREPPSALGDFDGDVDSWEQDVREVDRSWYNIDEGGNEVAQDFEGYDDFADREAELIQKAGGGPGAQPKKRLTARQAARNAENDQWERNQLALSGATGERRQLDFDSLDDDEESRVHLLVHDLKPPFLDGKTAFTKQLEPINPIKDPTSDLAVFSKKGSLLVRERRAQRERERVSADRHPAAVPG